MIGSSTGKIERILNFLFLLTIYFIPMETAMNLHIIGFLSAYKIPFILLCLLYIFYLFSDFKYNTLVAKENFLNAFKKYRWAFISLFLYFTFDIISLLWTNDILFSLKKYITILPMVILLFYANRYFYGAGIDEQKRHERLKILSAVFALMSLTISSITWIIYLIFGRTHYIMRMSLQLDYNQYILPVLLGYIAGIYVINYFKDDISKIIYFSTFSIITLPLLFTSGSRRTILIYMPIYFILSLFSFISSLKNKAKKSYLISFILAVVLVLGFHYLIIQGYQIKSRNIYEEMKKAAEKSGIDIPSATHDNSKELIRDFRKEQDLDFISNTIESGTAVGKREMIYSVVIDEIKSYSIKEWLIGKGGSHQTDLFKTEKALERFKSMDKYSKEWNYSHPHSMIFVDLLNGGLIKLSLTISFILSIFYYTIKIALRKNYKELILILLFGGVHLSNQIIDSIYGIEQNRLTWIFFYIILGSIGLSDKRHLKYKSRSI
ncbi:MAG: hypothetical protein Q4P34_06070 [Tissierellia bacterium]|nr:hypothetical protein [Tissierellia bacterium]